MSATSSVTVECPAGTITGEPHYFRSIPYAKARPFADAEKLEPLRIDATGKHEGLYLTLATPEARFGADAPVIVYIHGGGYDGGTRFDARTEPTFFREQGFVVVSVDYRVGLEGFARFHDDEANRYRGIDDCVLALEWVQKNIEHFGGDPTNVTLIGQSAGAGIALWLTRRGTVPRSPWIMRLAILGIIAPFAANIAGWIFTEIGRQPFVVAPNPDSTGIDGVFMYTAAAVSPGVTAGELLFSVIALTLVYAVILVVELFLLVRYVRGGTAAAMPELTDDHDDTDDPRRDDVLAFAY